MPKNIMALKAEQISKWRGCLLWAHTVLILITVNGAMVAAGTWSRLGKHSDNAPQRQ